MKIRNQTKSKQHRSSRTDFIIAQATDTDWESDVDPLFAPQNNHNNNNNNNNNIYTGLPGGPIGSVPLTLTLTTVQEPAVRR